MAYPARHHDEARKLQPRAVQRWVSEQQEWLPERVRFLSCIVHCLTEANESVWLPSVPSQLAYRKAERCDLGHEARGATCGNKKTDFAQLIAPARTRPPRPVGQSPLDCISLSVHPTTCPSQNGGAVPISLRASRLDPGPQCCQSTMKRSKLSSDAVSAIGAPAPLPRRAASPGPTFR